MPTAKGPYRTKGRPAAKNHQNLNRFRSPPPSAPSLDELVRLKPNRHRVAVRHHRPLAEHAVADHELQRLSVRRPVQLGLDPLLSIHHAAGVKQLTDFVALRQRLLQKLLRGRLFADVDELVIQALGIQPSQGFFTGAAIRVVVDGEHGRIIAALTDRSRYRSTATTSGQTGACQQRQRCRLGDIQELTGGQRRVGDPDFIDHAIEILSPAKAI